jgi:hypothetical protein
MELETEEAEAAVDEQAGGGAEEEGVEHEGSWKRTSSSRSVANSDSKRKRKRRCPLNCSRTSSYPSPPT